jgi:hypothetical protein
VIGRPVFGSGLWFKMADEGLMQRNFALNLVLLDLKRYLFLCQRREVSAMSNSTVDYTEVPHNERLAESILDWS